MIFALVLAVVAVAWADPDETFCNGRAAGKYAPADDTKCHGFFYLCKNDHTYVTNCPEGKFYHASSESCQLPAIACPPPTTTQQAPTEPPFSCIGRKQGYYLPRGVSCSSIFYLCKNDHTYTNTCPAGKFFDRKSNTCQLQSVACPQNNPPGECNSRTVNQYFADSSAPCSAHYFVCIRKLTEDQPRPRVSYELVQITCANGTFWDHELQTCNYFSETPACSGVPRQPTEEPTTPAFEKPEKEIPFECQEPGRFANPSQACDNHFVACTEDLKAITMVCAPGSFFDEFAGGVCAFRDQVPACGGTRPEVDPDLTTPAPLPPLPLTCSEPGLFANPTQACSEQYVACDEALKANTLLCPPGTAFDDVLKVCAYEEEIPECGGERPPTEAPRTTLPPPEQIPFDCTTTGHFANPNQACDEKYIRCAGTIAHTMRCAPGTFFDALFETCGYKEEIPECGGVRPAPTPSNPIEEFSCIGRKPGQYAPIGIECPTYFHTCKNDHTYTTTCPPRKAFHASSGTCQLKSIACPPQTPKPMPPKTTTTTQQTPTEPPFSCLGREAGSYTPPGIDCPNFFYLCKNDHTYTTACPEGKFWHQKSRSCQLREIACPAPTTTQATPPEFSCIGREAGKYLPPGVACSNFFYLCKNDHTYTTACPENKRFHVASGTCQVPEIACGKKQ